MLLDDMIDLATAMVLFVHDIVPWIRGSCVS
jgi:hypothetical protein